MLWSKMSIEAEAGVSQFRSILAVASLGAGEIEPALDSSEMASERLFGDSFLLLSLGAAD